MRKKLFPMSKTFLKIISLFSFIFLIHSSPTFAADVDVVWTDLVGVSVNGNDLTKTAGSGWGNSGAASDTTFTGDFGLEFTVSETNTYRMLGLSDSNINANYNTIDFGIYPIANGTFRVYENGVYKGSFGSYQANDVFKINRVGTTITYERNGVVFYTSATSSSGPLLADAALNSYGSTILDVKFVGATVTEPNAINDLSGSSEVDSVDLAWTAPNDNGSPITEYEVQYGTVASGTFSMTYTDDSAPGATINGLTMDTAYQFRVVAKNAIGSSLPSNVIELTPEVKEDVVWTDLVGVAVTGNDLNKTAGSGWGNSGAASDKTYNGDFGLEFSVSETNTYRMLGLSDTNVNANYNTIDYGIYPIANGTWRVYENGAYRGSFGTYQSGDIFRINRNGTTVTYLKNGVVAYTSTISSTGPLLADAALNSYGSNILDAKFAGVSVNVLQPIDDLSGIASSTSVDLSWTAPYDNGSPITEYEVQYGTVTSGTFNMTYTDDAVPGATISGLTTGTTYQFRVITKTAVETSPPSNVLELAAEDKLDIVWTDLVGVTATGNDLVKNYYTAWGNGGAASSGSYDGDFGVEFTAYATDKYRLCGLSDVNTDAHYTSIDYAIYLLTDATFAVFENGVSRGVFGSYSSGDVFQVYRTGTTITYKQNGTVVYTSTISSSGPLLVDTAFYTHLSRIYDAKYVGVTADEPRVVNDLSGVPALDSIDLTWTAPYDSGSPITEYEVQYGTVTSGTFATTYTDDAIPGATITGLTTGEAYQFRVIAKNSMGSSSFSNIFVSTPDYESDVLWTDLVGAVVVGNNLRKSDTLNGWNAGGASHTKFGGDIALEVTASTDDYLVVVGLSADNPDTNWATIDYAIYFTNTLTADVYENGVLKGSLGGFQTGDKFKVERTGSTVIYLKNNVVLYTSTVPTTDFLLVDASLHYYFDSVIDAKIIGQPYTFSNISHTANKIDPTNSETSTINFTLSDAADITIKIYEGIYSPEGEYSKVYVDTILSNDPRTAGANTFVWDGEDSLGGALTSGIYAYTIEAVNSYVAELYDPEYVPGVATVSNGTVTPANFNPHAGETATISYDLAVPSWVRIWIGDINVFAHKRSLLYQAVRDTTNNIELWDGRDDNGDIVSGTEMTVVVWANILPDNVIILDHHSNLSVDEVKADPYAIYPVYGQTTEITYTLSESANVTITIVDEADQVVTTLVNDVATNFGTHTVEWDGKDDFGKFVNTEGNYKVRTSITVGTTTKVLEGNITVFN